MDNKKLIIKKILNNNAVIAKDESNNELIAFGNGIGFRHKYNDALNQKEILKIYYQTNNYKSQQLQNLMAEIPFDCIETTNKVIELAEKRLKMKLSNNLLIPLADHINYSIKRYKQGLEIPILINEEVKTLYKDEYNCGLEAIGIINSKYGIKLQNDEASAIAFHIINAENDNSAEHTVKIMNGVKKVLSIVQSSFNVELNEETTDYSRFIIHLKFLFNKILLKNTKSDVVVKNLYKNIFANKEEVNECINKIEAYIKDSFKYNLLSEDKLYLAIHICKLLNNW